MNHHEIIQGDCYKILREWWNAEKEIPVTPDGDRVDLVFTSPPYEDARTYGMGFKLTAQDWVDWAQARFRMCYNICKGLTAWVVQGKTHNFQWSATPALLMADLHRAGIKLRNPPFVPAVFHRVGIPGSGGPDWLRANCEWVICASPERLPWSDNTAMGHPTKYDQGGACTNRLPNGERVGYSPRSRRAEVGSHRAERQAGRKYAKPRSGIANPGNVLHPDVISGNVGKGHMGSDLAHETEAPFPEWLAEFFIRSFCRPGGTVLDPFCGSGTTAAVAEKLGRNSINIDVRQSQCDLTARRLQEARDAPKKENPNGRQ